jgi:hypothetical protein
MRKYRIDDQEVFSLREIQLLIDRGADGPAAQDRHRQVQIVDPFARARADRRARASVEISRMTSRTLSGVDLFPFIA